MRVLQELGDRLQLPSARAQGALVKAEDLVHAGGADKDMVAMVGFGIKVGKSLQAGASRADRNPRVDVLPRDLAAGEHLAVVEFFVAPAGDDSGVAGAGVLERLDVAIGAKFIGDIAALVLGDRKSTRLNSSHVRISYAVFCLKKK